MEKEKEKEKEKEINFIDSTIKKGTIEEIYQKKTPLEHILLRPDTYIGSTEPTTEINWIYDEKEKIIKEKKITYVPGLFKIFDEILVNAADNSKRDKKQNKIKVKINREKNRISVWNNGKNIPIKTHKEYNCYIPTLLFGQLLTGSNFDDGEKKITGGRNGYGAKLTKYIFQKIYS